MRSVQSRTQLGTASLYLWVPEGGVGVEVEVGPGIVLEKHMELVFVYQKSRQMIQSIVEKDVTSGERELWPRDSLEAQSLDSSGGLE